MSGAKVVLALFGATLAVAVLAVTAFLLTDEDRLLCVEGELQDNAVDAEGRFIPRKESFATIEEAEAFVCKRVPHPRDTGGLVLQSVEVVRDTNLGTLIEGDGGFSLSLRYLQDAEGTTPEFGTWDLTFMATLPPASGTSDSIVGGDAITLGGEPAAILQAPGEDSATVFWDRDSFNFEATANIDDELTLEDLLSILESVR